MLRLTFEEAMAAAGRGCQQRQVWTVSDATIIISWVLGTARRDEGLRSIAMIRRGVGGGGGRGESDNGGCYSMW